MGLPSLSLPQPFARAGPMSPVRANFRTGSATSETPRPPTRPAPLVPLAPPLRAPIALRLLQLGVKSRVLLFWRARPSGRRFAIPRSFPTSGSMKPDPWRSSRPGRSLRPSPPFANGGNHTMPPKTIANPYVSPEGGLTVRAVAVYRRAYSDT